MAARFYANKDQGIYGIRVDKNVKKAKVDIVFSWSDLSGIAGVAIRSVNFNGQGGNINLTYSGAPSGGDSGSTNVSSYTTGEREWPLALTGDPSPLNLRSADGNTLKFGDLTDQENNAVITLSVSNVEYYPSTEQPPPPLDPEDPTTDPPPPPPPPPCGGPGPWTPAVPSVCPTRPSPNEVDSGLLIRKDGDVSVVLNLKKFANKLVTLKLTHQTSASWVQTFRFSVPSSSDISPDTGGDPYSKGDYFNSAILGTNEFFFYNVDGGDHDYYFTHGFILPTSKPTRTNYRLECVGDPPVCTCVPFTETYTGPWPPCKPEVGILNSGGNIVRWQFHDGNGSFTAQQVTLEVVSVKNAVPSSGAICSSTLKSNVWVPDPNDLAANGNCLGDYLNHSQKVRFRIPDVSASKTSLSQPICFSDFRGVAGGSPPDVPGGSTSNQYSVLHVYDEVFNQQVDLTLSNGIAVTVENGSDTYVSPFGESDPFANTNLGTNSRRHYTVQLTDGTIVDDTVSNVDIVIPQDLTAGGLAVTDITVFKKTKVSSNSFKVWFYTSFKNQETFDNDAYHLFDDDTNQTDSESELVFPEMTIVPQNPTEPGNSDPAYTTLDASNKKHYLITFLDSTIIADAEASNITIYDRAALTASGVGGYIYVSKKERVDSKTMKVWFRGFDDDRPEGKKYDNTFVRLWGIRRNRDVNHSGNVFVRNWYINPQL